MFGILKWSQYFPNPWELENKWPTSEAHIMFTGCCGVRKVNRIGERSSNLGLSNQPFFKNRFLLSQYQRKWWGISVFLSKFEINLSLLIIIIMCWSLFFTFPEIIITCSLVPYKELFYGSMGLTLPGVVVCIFPASPSK